MSNNTSRMDLLSQNGMYNLFLQRNNKYNYHNGIHKFYFDRKFYLPHFLMYTVEIRLFFFYILLRSVSASEL